jgi:TIR domain
MEPTPNADKVAYPGGYDQVEQIATVHLAARRHFAEVPSGELEGAIVTRFLEGLIARHPEGLPSRDPYHVRVLELVSERGSLLNSHLKLSWFRLAYWSCGLIAVLSGLSIAEYDGIEIFLEPIVASLAELGIDLSPQDCLDEIERFVPLPQTRRSTKSPGPGVSSVQAATHLFLSYLRFLHHAALRRRRVVTPDLALPTVAIVSAAADAQEAEQMTRFLTGHGVSLVAEPGAAPRGARLLVLLSPAAMTSQAFWLRLADWQSRPVIPMVVCLMARAELYGDTPLGAPSELWAWLGDNVAIELGGGNDRYVMLLRALDSPDPKQWWWQGDDAIEIGLAVDVLGEGLPRPRTRREPRAPAGQAYPNALQGTLLAAFFLASDRLARGRAPDRDARYFAVCHDLLELRKNAPSEPYGIAWFVLIYRVWLAFAAQMPGRFYTAEDMQHAESEMRAALFALGIGTDAEDVPGFLQVFANLPWSAPATSIRAIDERTAAFLALVYHLSNAALTRGQRMRVQHPARSCFISYARADEPLAHELAAHLEAKGADVWLDLNVITLGAPLDETLRTAVQSANCLFLIATPAADRSPYVRLEVEAALRQGLRIVPILPHEGLPSGFDALRASTPSGFERPIAAADTERVTTLAAALARLQRTPREQLEWLRSLPTFQSLGGHVARARER